MALGCIVAFLLVDFVEDQVFEEFWLFKKVCG
jgi:hypothetical protein